MLSTGTGRVRIISMGSRTETTRPLNALAEHFELAHGARPDPRLEPPDRPHAARAPRRGTRARTYTHTTPDRMAMDTTDAPQIIEHANKSLNFTPYDVKWVPSDITWAHRWDVYLKVGCLLGTYAVVQSLFDFGGRRLAR